MEISLSWFIFMLKCIDLPAVVIGAVQGSAFSENLDEALQDGLLTYSSDLLKGILKSYNSCMQKKQMYIYKFMGLTAGRIAGEYEDIDSFKMAVKTLLSAGPGEAEVALIRGRLRRCIIKKKPSQEELAKLRFLLKKEPSPEEFARIMTTMVRHDPAPLVEYLVSWTHPPVEEWRKADHGYLCKRR